ncbi:MAG: hypothetical protein NXH82_13805 [Rhodobacteraceae bacterium]|nr:hypothetical protein [Paracoccaceae bacterium]
MKLKSVGLALLLCGTTASANEFVPMMETYLRDQIAGWSGDPLFVQALRSSNAATAGYDQATIDRLDKSWRAEVGAASTPTISPVLQNPAADRLRSIVEAAGGTITEIILMDAQGMNVAVSGVTSDMWQGDEAKHSETYAVGPGAVHFSDVELDESTQTFQGQISFTLTDPATAEALGAMTVGVDIQDLM